MISVIFHWFIIKYIHNKLNGLIKCLKIMLIVLFLLVLLLIIPVSFAGGNDMNLIEYIAIREISSNYYNISVDNNRDRWVDNPTMN